MSRHCRARARHRSWGATESSRFRRRLLILQIAVDVRNARNQGRAFVPGAVDAPALRRQCCAGDANVPAGDLIAARLHHARKLQIAIDVFDTADFDRGFVEAAVHPAAIGGEGRAANADMPATVLIAAHLLRLRRKRKRDRQNQNDAFQCGPQESVHKYPLIEMPADVNPNRILGKGDRDRCYR